MSISDDEFLVDAPARFYVGDDLVLLIVGVDVSGHCEFDAHYFELRGGSRPLVTDVGVGHGEASGEDCCLFPCWGDESVGDAAVFDAFADGIDVGVVPTREVVVDEDASSGV